MGLANGRWSAVFDVTKESQLSGVFRVFGVPGLSRGRVEGIVREGEVAFQLTSAGAHLQLSEQTFRTAFEGTLADGKIHGALLTLGHLRIDLDGDWGRMAPGSLIGNNTLNELNAGRPAVAIVSIERRVAERQAKLRASVKNREASAGNDTEVEEKIAWRTELASMKQSMLAVNEGVRVIRDFDALTSAEVEIQTVDALFALLESPSFGALEDPMTVRLAMNEALPLIRQSEAIQNGGSAAPYRIAIMDSGIDYETTTLFGPCITGPGPGCSISAAVVFGNHDNQRDGLGHGTAVASIAMRAGHALGVVSLDIFAGSISTNIGNVLDAVSWVLNNYEQHGIVAVNMSFSGLPNGIPPYTTTCDVPNGGSVAVEDAMILLDQTGINPVASSGNSGYGISSPAGAEIPACVPAVVGVGAVYDSDYGSHSGSCFDASPDANKVACYSNIGPGLEVMAPGSLITIEGVTESGTSFAAPLVSASIANLRGRLVGGVRRYANDSARCVVARLRNYGTPIDVLPPTGGYYPGTPPPPGPLDMFGLVTSQANSGDCNGDGEVRVNELMKAVRISLNLEPLSGCTDADRDGSGIIHVSELIGAVNTALTGCAAITNYSAG